MGEPSNIQRDLIRTLEVLRDADAGMVVRCDRCLLSFGAEGRRSAKRLFAHWFRCNNEAPE